jgi:hypothetical protein
LRKAIVSFVMSVCPSVRMEQMGFHWTDFHEIWCLSIFRKSAEKIQLSLKSGENSGLFTLRHLWYLADFFLEWEMFQTKVVEEPQTHVLCSITFSRKSCRLRDNVEKYGGARQATVDNIIRRTRFECWITKATNRNSQYVIIIAFPRQQWLRQSSSLLTLYYIASRVSFVRNA